MLPGLLISPSDGRRATTRPEDDAIREIVAAFEHERVDQSSGNVGPGAHPLSPSFSPLLEAWTLRR